MGAKEYLKYRSKLILDQITLPQEYDMVMLEDANEAIDMAINEVRKEYELTYKHVEETLEAIVQDCGSLTSGNVSHNSRCIQGIAQRRLDYIRKHKNGNT